jgi:hypothetical protein
MAPAAATTALSLRVPDEDELSISQTQRQDAVQPSKRPSWFLASSLFEEQGDEFIRASRSDSLSRPPSTLSLGSSWNDSPVPVTTHSAVLEEDPGLQDICSRMDLHGLLSEPEQGLQQLPAYRPLCMAPKLASPHDSPAANPWNFKDAASDARPRARYPASAQVSPPPGFGMEGRVGSPSGYPTSIPSQSAGFAEPVPRRRSSVGPGAAPLSSLSSREKDLTHWVMQTVAATRSGRMSLGALHQSLAVSSPNGLKSILHIGNGSLHSFLAMRPDMFILAVSEPSGELVVVLVDGASHDTRGSRVPISSPRREEQRIPRGNGTTTSGSATGACGSTRKRGSSALAWETVEETVVRETTEILREASAQSLKAVELANTLRARVGTEILAAVRERHGGLLSLLERHGTRFRVQRIPKSDFVTLIGDDAVKVACGSTRNTSPSPPQSQKPCRVLCVRNVSARLTEEVLLSVFGKYGHVESWQAAVDQGSITAYITYSHAEDARRAQGSLERETHGAGFGSVSFANAERGSFTSSEGLGGCGDPAGYSSDHSCTSSSESNRTTSLGSELDISSSGISVRHPANGNVLALLTSDQFVPTQAWPANFSADWPYIEAAVEQLRHVGGSTTVSKLRGLLRGRLSSVHTVKSVPLKAMLQAYEPIFVLCGNRVSLPQAVMTCPMWHISQSISHTLRAGGP